MEIAIFDDNEYSLQTLRDYIEKYFAVKENSECEIFAFSSTEKFREYYTKQRPDVVFVDIAVEGDSKFGLKCAEEIRAANGDAHIIFTTVMEQYMPLSFEGMIRPTHYLIKPIEEKKIFSLLKNIERKDKQLVLKSGAVIYKLNIGEILYIIQSKNKMSVYTQKKVVCIYKSLKSIYGELDENFVFVDKSALINIKEIKEADFRHSTITMNDGKVIDVSVRCKKVLKEILEKTL